MYTSEHVLALTGNRVVFNYKPHNESLTGVGLICDNKNNTEYNKGPEQVCEDYSVRFCCSEKGNLCINKKFDNCHHTIFTILFLFFSY